jgi:hypothetical protein
VYGSDTDGLLFKNDDEGGVEMAKEIAKLMNIQPYMLKEKATGLSKRAILPYSVQLHRNDARDEYYIINAHRLIPSEEPVINQEAAANSSQDLLEHLAQIESLSK